jgi:hypothetical protein
MTCPKCGAALKGSGKFCATCGAPVDQAGKRPSGAPPTSKAATTGVVPQKPMPEVKIRSTDPPPKSKVDPLGSTSPDAFAETAVGTTRDQLERAIEEHRKSQPRVATNAGGHGAPPAPTQEMLGVPSVVGQGPVSPKAMSHVVPSQGVKTAALPQQPTPAPMSPIPLLSGPPGGFVPPAPSSPGPSGGPMGRGPGVPLSPSSSGGLPALSPPPVGPYSMPHPVQNTPHPSLSPFHPGAQVMVLWANRQRYRGTVQQVVPPRVLVAFPDGQQHWVEMQYVSIV